MLFSMDRPLLQSASFLLTSLNLRQLFFKGPCRIPDFRLEFFITTFLVTHLRTAGQVRTFSR